MCKGNTFIQEESLKSCCVLVFFGERLFSLHRSPAERANNKNADVCNLYFYFLFKSRLCSFSKILEDWSTNLLLKSATSRLSMLYTAVCLMEGATHLKAYCRTMTYCVGRGYAVCHMHFLMAYCSTSSIF
jgi:hypothetical protein